MKKLFISIVVLALMVGFVGCPKKNNPPEIQGITVTPPDSIKVGTQAHLKVNASDPDGDQLEFTWSATAGTLSATSGEEVDWTAPQDAGTYTITVEAKDEDGETDQATASIKVYRESYVYGENNTQVILYEGYWNTSRISISGAPNNAVADSLELTVDIMHPYPQYLRIDLEPPNDPFYWIVWDQNYPGGKRSIKIDCNVGIPFSVNGDWDISIGVYTGGGNGALNSWSLKIWYHTP